MAAEEAFDPETNWTWELGTKGTLLEGRLGFDAALFYVDWKDMQFPALSPCAAIPQTVTLNVGTATSRGVELALRAALARGLTANVGFSYTDAEFDHAVNRSLISLPSFTASGGDISGFDLPRTSPVQWNLGLDYRRAAFADFDFFGRADYSYKASQKPLSDGLAETGDMQRVNARIGMSPTIGASSCGAQLTTTRPTSTFRDAWPATMSTGSWRCSHTVSYPRLRTYGLTIGYKF